MKAAIYLRIASALTLIHSILHTVGGVFGKADPGAATVAWNAMKDNPFLLMGHVRTYADFYRGLGLGVTISLTVEGIVFWFLGSLASSAGTRLRPILWTFLLGYLVFSVNSYEYFFFGPVIAEILIATCFAAAIFTLQPAPVATA